MIEAGLRVVVEVEVQRRASSCHDVTSQHSIYLRQTLEDAEKGTSRTSARVGASCHSATAVGVPLLVSDILSFLARCLPGFQAAVVTLKLSATVATAAKKLTELMPDWRRRPAVLRTGLRVATAGALAHHTMVSVLLNAEHMNRVSHTNSAPSLLPAMVKHLPEIEKKLIDIFFYSTHLWSTVLAQDGVNESPGGPFRFNKDFFNSMTTDRVAIQPSPSSPQLAPLALDLVLGMENTLQMVMRQQDMVWKWPFWNDGNLVQSIVDGYQTLLALFGHVIEVLATPTMLPQDLCLALAQGGTIDVPRIEMIVKEDQRAMGVALSKLQPKQVWTWQALAAGTPAEATLQ
ncbi:hypothetical protein HaLaN_04901, partial [Haematococcus lacustris]